MMIELLYLASQIQCGADGSLINVQVDVYQNSALVRTMSVNDRAYFPVNSINNLTFQYRFINSNCNPVTPTEVVLNPSDPFPNLPAASEQQSIQQLLNDLNSYEQLLLVELGTTNTTSTAYDLQDAVFVINNNPVIAD